MPREVMYLDLIQEETTDVRVKVVVQEYFNALKEIEQGAPSMEEAMQQRIKDGTRNDPCFQKVYKEYKYWLCEHAMVISTSHNLGSLRDMLCMRQVFVLCSTVSACVATLERLGITLYDFAIQRFNDKFLKGDTTDPIVRLNDGRTEYIMCTSYQQMMEVMEESIACRRHLLVPSTAACA